MRRTRQIHDGIVGALISAGVGLGYFVDPLWLILPGLIGLTLLQSGVTGFCPVYFILDKTCADVSPGHSVSQNLEGQPGHK